MAAQILSVIGLCLQAATVLLAGFSAYYIWRQLKEVALAAQATVSERLASQSIDILHKLGASARFYEFFYENRPLEPSDPDRAYVLCLAEIMTNFLEHIVLQRASLPAASCQAWMEYVRDHYHASQVVRSFVADHPGWYAQVFVAYVTHAPPADGRETRVEAA